MSFDHFLLILFAICIDFDRNTISHFGVELRNKETEDTNQHCLISSLNPSGHVVGTGRWRLLEPTPQIIAEESTSL